MQNAESIKHWLAKQRTNGINIQMPELLYYQNKTALIELAPRYAIQSKLAGSYLAKTKGRGMEFDEVRHYQPGDDIRAIDWRVTARTGKAHTKLFREEKERPVFILTDLSQSMRFGSQYLFKSLQAAHLAALIAWSTGKRGDRVGGLVINQDNHREIKPRARQKGVLHYLHALTELDVEQTTSKQFFADACARLRRLARPGSLIYLISDFYDLDDKSVQHLVSTSRHSELRAFQISDPLEHQLPDVSAPQLVSLTDGEKQQTLLLGEQKVSQRYFHHCENLFEHRRQLLAKAKCPVVEVTAAQPLEQQLKGITGANRAS